MNMAVKPIQSRDNCEVAIIGAGPYGLATAAHLRAASAPNRPNPPLRHISFSRVDRLSCASQNLFRSALNDAAVWQRPQSAPKRP